MHVVAGRLGAGLQRTGQRQRAAVGRHGRHLQLFAADSHPIAGHRRRELAGHAGQRGAALGGLRGAGRQLGLALGGRPGLLGPVEVDLRDHAVVEGLRHIQQVGQRFLHERQAAQAELGDVDRLQVVEHVGQCQQQVFHLDVGEAQQLVEAFGLELQAAAQRVAADAHDGGRAAGQRDAGHRGVDRQRGHQLVLPGVELEGAIDKADVAAQVEPQRGLVVRLAAAVHAGLADADIHRAQAGRDDHVAG